LQTNKVYEDKVLNDQNQKMHSKINFYLPHEFGGAGDPIQDNMYGYFNIYTPDMDLAIIKPRWTTRQEFKVELPQNPRLVEAEEQLMDQEPGSGIMKEEFNLGHNL
jgi:hypothetical protein